VKKQRKLLAAQVDPDLYRAYKEVMEARGLTVSEDLRKFIKLRVKHHRLEREGRGEEMFDA
jgi:hypothetical protein